jgi:predicted aminopeptidase
MLKVKIRLILNVLLFLIMLCCLIWHELIIYGIRQGKGQLMIVKNAQPVEEILNDSSFPDSLKQKLILISEIKKFAFDSLGINYSENYSTVYNQHGKPVLWTVSAAEPYELKAKEWKFPFLGTVSYKGFFEKEPLQKEILKLRKDNYDVDVYSPSGWSTLGWFKDPILSGMLKRDEGSLANLIIHELTHGTLYVKNNVTFNENLANFIGDKGAELFLSQRFGNDSKEYKEYQDDKEDEHVYNDYILLASKKLKKLYSSFKPEDTDSFKKERKKQMITEIVLQVNRLKLHKTKRLFRYTLQAFQEGNAFFMAFSRYDSQYDKFEKEFKEQYSSDLKKYLKAMKEKYPSL